MDRSVPEHAALADFLRASRAGSQMTYGQLATAAQLSPATLKRAASGAGVPKLGTVLAYLTACTPPGLAVRESDIDQARLLWKKARYASVLPRYSYRAPDPNLCATADDLRSSLRDLHVWAGRPTMRAMEGGAGGLGILPRSTTHRISLGKALPNSERQMRSYLTACDVPRHRHEEWVQALQRVRPVTERPTSSSTPFERKAAGRRGRPRGPIRAATREAYDLAVFLRRLVDTAGIGTRELSQRLRVSASRTSVYLAGGTPPHDFVVALVRAVVPPAVAERQLANALSLWDRAMNPALRSGPGAHGAIARYASREVEVFERLTASLERQEALRESIENSQKLIFILMTMIGKLQVDISTIERERLRVHDMAPSFTDLAERLHRAQEQTERAMEELERAKRARDRAEELALRLQQQITGLRFQLAGPLRQPSGPHESLESLPAPSRKPTASEPGDIDLALSKAQQLLSRSEAEIDQIADDLEPRSIGRAAA
ncbi:helix-turn-helix domain-containing protein [Streptomyces sp. NPDC058084]|uniref:helix-turn-helix domain-containing protein n=1 Tax=Streptomyces sp. NPDC058084 TaxID=3346333 RepID=UPI0036EAF8C9